MGTFEMGLKEEHYKSVGKITVNFNILEQMVSFCIWSLIEKDELTTKLLTAKLEPADVENIVRYIILTPQGIEKLMKKRMGQIITAEMSFHHKIDLLSSLYKNVEHDKEKLVELKELLDRVNEAEAKRNAIIHSLWIMDATLNLSNVKTAAKQHNGWKLQIRPISVLEIEKVSDFIAAVAYDVQTFALRIYDPSFRKA